MGIIRRPRGRGLRHIKGILIHLFVNPITHDLGMIEQLLSLLDGVVQVRGRLEGSTRLLRKKGHGHVRLQYR